MVGEVAVKTVPSRCPHCQWKGFVRLVPMPPDVEPTVRYLPITGVLEVRGRVVLGLLCDRCRELIAEGERPLELKAELRHDSPCPGALDILEVDAETFQQTDHQNRRHDGATVTVRVGCPQCQEEASLEATVSLRRNEYDLVHGRGYD
jgi:hypothetical protein